MGKGELSFPNHNGAYMTRVFVTILVFKQQPKHKRVHNFMSSRASSLSTPLELYVINAKKQTNISYLCLLKRSSLRKKKEKERKVEFSLAYM